jgi:hypothetical protein
LHTRFKRLVVGSIAAVGLSLGLLGGLGITAAHASVYPAHTPCSGNSCDYLDPGFSYQQYTNPPAYCSGGAGDSTDLPNGAWVLGGLLELRWGPNCQTNWTRFTPGNDDHDFYSIWVQRDKDGATAGYDFGQAPGVSQHTDQLYIPGPATACVHDHTLGEIACFDQATGQVTTYGAGSV